jgi:hypothetical protein
MREAEARGSRGSRKAAAEQNKECNEDVALPLRILFHHRQTPLFLPPAARKFEETRSLIGGFVTGTMSRA